MNIKKTIKQRVPYAVTSIALLLAAIAPGFISNQAFAAQVTERSIGLSSSSISATAVTYDVNFTSVASAGAFAINFCSNSPDPAAACTAPTGFDAASAASVTAGFTTVTGSTNKVIVSGTIGATTAIKVAINGITNPSTTGPLYARIATFADGTDAAAGTPKIDEGSVAISINNTIGVSGAVLESLTFCVANAAITADCANASSNLPTLKLGETVGSVVALSPGVVSTGLLYTQLSTNASTGAVVTLKSATDCGGLKRVGAAVCDIAPALQTDILSSSPTAKFGVKTATATSTVGAPAANGILQPVSGSGYNATTYAFNYVGTNLSGVTSTLGDPFLDTAGAPVNNQNMQLTFGATVTNATPAGNYSTSLSMIATGKF